MESFGWIVLAAIVFNAMCVYNEYGNPPILWGKDPKIRCLKCRRTNKWDDKHIGRNGLVCKLCGGEMIGVPRLSSLTLMYLIVGGALLVVFVGGLIIVNNSFPH